MFSIFQTDKVIDQTTPNVPWNDIFAHLIQQPNSLNRLTELFAQHAKPIAEELIDAYLSNNHELLSQYEVKVGGIAGLKRKEKTNKNKHNNTNKHRRPKICEKQHFI